MHKRKQDTRRRHPSPNCEDCGKAKVQKGNTAQLYCRDCHNEKQRIAQLLKRAEQRVLKERLGMPQAPEGRGSERYKAALEHFRNHIVTIPQIRMADETSTPLNADTPPDPTTHRGILKRRNWWRNTGD